MRFRHNIALSLLLLPLLLLPYLTVHAVPTAAGESETLDSVLARAAAQQEMAIAYREVRHLQLLAEPWQAEGNIYVSSSAFVIEQLMPKRQLLCADRSRLWLLIPERRIRRSMMLTAPMAQKSLSLIKPIMHGDRMALEKNFAIAFSIDNGRWQIELMPKEGEESPYSRVTVAGKLGQAADSMTTELPDGDDSQWTFRQLYGGVAVGKRIEALTREAKGI